MVNDQGVDEVSIKYTAVTEKRWGICCGDQAYFVGDSSGENQQLSNVMNLTCSICIDK